MSFAAHKAPHLISLCCLHAPHFPRVLLGSHYIYSAHAGSLQALTLVLIITKAFKDQIRMFP
jgi:hypothetical protein